MPSPAVVRVLARPQDARREDPDGGLSERRPLLPHTCPPEGRAAAHDRLVQRELALVPSAAGPPVLARTRFSDTESMAPHLPHASRNRPVTQRHSGAFGSSRLDICLDRKSVV